MPDLLTFNNVPVKDLSANSGPFSINPGVYVHYDAYDPMRSMKNLYLHITHEAFSAQSLPPQNLHPNW